MDCLSEPCSAGWHRGASVCGRGWSGELRIRAFASTGLGIAMCTTPDLWFDSTVRAAAALCAGQTIAAAASPAVAILTTAVLATVCIEHLKFVVACVAAAALLLVVAGASSVIGASRPDAGIPAQSDSSNGAEEPAGLGVGLWIRGIVVDTSGQPVSGARVTTRVGSQPRVVTAKADGTFAIWSDQTPARYASLRATADGGARQGTFRFYDRLGVRQGPRALARIVLKPAHEITVSVVDARGVAVEGAHVVPLDVASAVDDGLTDARGVVTVRARKTRSCTGSLRTSRESGSTTSRTICSCRSTGLRCRSGSSSR